MSIAYFIPVYNTSLVIQEIIKWDKTMLIYSKKSWKEIQPLIQIANSILLFEAETQSMPSVKDLQNMKVKNVVIEEADLFYNQYDGGRFIFEDLFRKYLDEGIKVYFSAMWKKADITENLKKYNIEVIDFEIGNFIKPQIIENKTEEIKEISIKPIIKETYIQKEKQKDIIEKKSIIDAPKKHQHKKSTFLKKEENLDLEFFYNQPKTTWQKIKIKLSKILDILINNF